MPDLIIDTHWYSSDLDYCETHQDESWRINVEGTRNVERPPTRQKANWRSSQLTACTTARNPRPTPRRNCRSPFNYYGKTKVIAESAVSVLCKDFLIARTAVLFGPSSASYSGKLPFPAWIVRELKEGNKIRVVTDQYSNLTYADNLADFLFALLSKGASGVFNVSGADNLSRYDLALEIADLFGFDPRPIEPIKTAELHQVAQRSKRVILDISKAEGALGMKGMPIKEALRNPRCLDETTSHRRAWIHRVQFHPLLGLPDTRKTA